MELIASPATLASSETCMSGDATAQTDRLPGACPARKFLSEELGCTVRKSLFRIGRILPQVSPGSDLRRRAHGTPPLANLPTAAVPCLTTVIPSKGTG
ncbi:hypothetical protein KM043_010608 [Ampulex compressa]|nr:hypothetical protein KM043_010608 [Ampulex compressa]